MITISIDFGTYNSAAAYKHPSGEIELLQAYHGPTMQGKVIPSFLKFYPNGELDKYGEPAREFLSIAPQLVIWGLKRLIGKSYKEAKSEFHRFHYPIKEADDGSILIPIGNKDYTPIQLVTLFLQKVKEDCESPAFNPIGSSIEKVIITYPAYFDSRQIASLKESALEVGFKEVELVTEPEAAAAAYKDIIDFRKKPLVMVIDLGAGTLDIVICRFLLDKTGKPVVKSSYPPYGDTRLGGIDMDDILLNKVKELYSLQKLNKESEGKLRLKIEKAKISLSENPWVKEFFSVGHDSFSINLARSFEDLPPGENLDQWIVLDDVLKEVLEKFKNHLSFALEKEGLFPEDIDQLILVGGPMNMHCVRKVIKEVFSKNRKILEQLELIESKGFPISPLEAVVKGALIRGIEEVITPHAILSYTYGVLIDGEIAENTLVEEGTLIPKGEKLIKEGPVYSEIPGKILKISLYKKKREKIGITKEHHLRVGNYEFIPIFDMKGLPSYRPKIEINENGICRLIITDMKSKNDLSLIFKSEREEEIGYEPNIKEPLDLEEPPSLPPEIEKEIKEKIKEIEERAEEISQKERIPFEEARLIAMEEIFGGGYEIPKKDVERTLNEAKFLIKIVNMSNYNFTRKTMELYSLVKQLLERVENKYKVEKKIKTIDLEFGYLRNAISELKNRLIEVEGVQI